MPSVSGKSSDQCIYTCPQSLEQNSTGTAHKCITYNGLLPCLANQI